MNSSKRILLMYISEVSGHHRATLAIEKALRAISPHLGIGNINAFKYTNPISEKVINRLYLGIIKRTPQIWDYLYDNPEVMQNIQKLKETIHKFNTPKLHRLFARFRPNVVCCTQAYPCGMVADYKKTYNSSLPLVAVLTDYAPHSYWVYDMVDYYIVPSDDVAVRLAQKGVSWDKIKPLGIPFDRDFNVPVDARAVYRKLGLDVSKPVILIMGGGQGLGPINKIVKQLEKVPVDFQELIVTGTNKRLYKSLVRRARRCRKKIHLFKYVNTINEFMSIASLIITKPGGITTAEALSKGLPMIIMQPIPGQEVNNTVFLTAHGAALKIEDIAQIPRIISDLLLNPLTLSHISQAAVRISKPLASDDIARLLLGLIHA